MKGRTKGARGSVELCNPLLGALRHCMVSFSFLESAMEDEQGSFDRSRACFATAHSGTAFRLIHNVDIK